MLSDRAVNVADSAVTQRYSMNNTLLGPDERAGRGRYMRRKPDLLWVLVVVFSLGMVTTGYTQSQWQSGSVTSAVAETDISAR